MIHTPPGGAREPLLHPFRAVREGFWQIRRALTRSASNRQEVPHVFAA